MNGQPRGEGLFGGGHERWDPEMRFSSTEEVKAAVASMIAKGIKGGELFHDPTKKEVQERVLSALEGVDPTTLTPMDVANQIEESLYGSHYGKTEFKRPKSIPEREGGPAPAI